MGLFNVGNQSQKHTQLGVVLIWGSC